MIPVIRLNHITTCFDQVIIHQNLNLTVQSGEVFGIIGESGSGKTTLLRIMLMLAQPISGSIKIFNQELTTASTAILLAIQRRFGVLFQHNALFSSLTIHENVCFPLKEHTQLDPITINELAMLKIRLSGLSPETAKKYPAELSGGMQKRAALARSLALDPELLFLDEPTAGLDPHTANGFNELILTLHATIGLTIVIITHDMNSLKKISTQVAFLGDKKVLCTSPFSILQQNSHPIIQTFFSQRTQNQ